ncbi:MFS transporter [Legionella pneumophila]|uniref:MFS transporter DHA1 family arabinose polymer transporter n=1 Tax=Legionella pneumophila subsp. pascullei TaxID=91890 RepID=A0AAX2IT66_LEGPN|nr:MFS transporter [Legionella pneumophila]AMP90939.1 MFS transporter [Legionella pneumophila subsp. pascullei]AMP93924.1 MFS transporter [Legionella pneumophila subsp. pascullei]AMP96840.1 MFS transporter [Legionella pneumophila subsp. pascullei]SQG89031.1 MFS transporter DHA1 family arabinose polymer transporter [Legionella pneumophila subsp. pascullei]VEH04081.1 MFS transporter DHA1 family arabinose polymer transporter [Legionella pneumophila subsp. pascullei]
MLKNLIFLAIGMFTVGCNTFLIAGLLPQIGQTIGQPVAVVGQGVSLFSLTYLLSAPFFSILFANKPVKRIIQLALALLLFGNLITLLSENIVLFLIGRSLAGAGTGIFTPLCISIAVYFVSPSAKGRVLSFVWSANSAGVVFGVPAGLYLSSTFNWQLSIASLIILSLLALIGFSLQNTDIRLPKSPSFGLRLHLILDRKTLSVIGVTCVTAVASLGLYSYVTLIQSGSPNSLSMTLLSWGVGGFLGSSLIGVIIDRTGKPRLIMALILAGLMLALIAIPFTRSLPYLGLIPFFMWGAFGWAIATPQQHILYELHENQGTILAAINSSALGLGSALGTLLGGLIISYGFREIYLPLPAATLLLFVLIGQLIINNSNKVNNT